MKLGGRGTVVMVVRDLRSTTRMDGEGESSDVAVSMMQHILVFLLSLDFSWVDCVFFFEVALGCRRFGL